MCRFRQVVINTVTGPREQGKSCMTATPFIQNSAPVFCRVVLTAAILAGPVRPARCDGPGSPLMREFLDGIRHAADLLENVELEGRTTLQQFLTVPNPLAWPQVRRNVGPDSMVEDGVFHYPKNVVEFGICGRMVWVKGRKKGLETILACNERYAFGLSKEAEGGAYVLTQLFRMGTPEAEAAVRESGAVSVRYAVLSPWEFLGWSLAEGVEMGRFIPTEIFNETQAGKRAVRVIVDFIPEGSSETIEGIELVCDPGSHWMIREASWHTQRNPSRPHRLVISDTRSLRSGLDVSVRVRTDYVYEGSQNPKTAAECDAVESRHAETDILSESTDPARFYLSYYGLDEPTFQTPWYTSGWVLLVIGCVFTAVGAGLLRSRRNRR